MQAPQRMQRSIVLEIRAQHVGAAVVDEDDVVFLRPVDVARPARPVDSVVLTDMSCPVAERASTRISALASSSVGAIFFNRSDDDVNLREKSAKDRRCLRFVTMIDVPARRPESLGSSDADVGCEKLRAQFARASARSVSGRLEVAIGRRCVCALRNSASTSS